MKFECLISYKEKQPIRTKNGEGLAEKHDISHNDQDFSFSTVGI